jgi:hypothetical protein
MGYGHVPSTLTLTAIAGLSIVGAALGVHLGHSAIGEIDPAYFRDPPVPFHSALAPNLQQDWAQVQATEYGQVAAPITQCIGCIDGPVPDYPVEYVPGRDPYVDTASSGWPPKARRVAIVEQDPEPVQVEAAPDPVRERIVRYSSYPVTQEEAREMAASDWAEDGSDEDFAATR